MSRHTSESQSDERIILRGIRSIGRMWRVLTIISVIFLAGGGLMKYWSTTVTGRMDTIERNQEWQTKNLGAANSRVDVFQAQFTAHLQDDQKAELASEIRQIRLEGMVQSLRDHFSLPPIAGLPSLPSNSPLAGSGDGDGFDGLKPLPPHAGK